MRTNRRFYLLVLLLGAASAVALGTSAAFLTLYALLLLPLAALISLLCYPATVRAWPRCEQSWVFKGDQPVLDLRIFNGGWLPYPDVSISLLDTTVAYQPENSEDGPVLSLPARRRQSRRYILRFPYRGVYRVGLKEVRVTDFLGLFRMRFAERRAQRVTVFPALIDDFSMPLSPRRRNEGDAGPDLFAGQSSDVSDVRRHDPGDDYRKIHWKLTAKRGEFIVKNYRTPGLPRTMIVLDTADAGHSERVKPAFDDRMASLAASALDFCLKNRQAARLIYGDGASDFLDTIRYEDMQSAFELLAVLPFERAAGTLKGAVHSLLLSRQPFADLVVLAGGIDEALCDLLKAAVSAGHATLFYFVCSASASPSQADYALFDALTAGGVKVETFK